jgi:hypothetical protein
MKSPEEQAYRLKGVASIESSLALGQVKQFTVLAILRT